MAEKISLDDVLLTPEVVGVWQRQAEKVAKSFRGAGMDAKDIPDEQGRIEADGSLTIFVILPNGVEVSLSVPKGQWQRRLERSS